MENKQHEIQQQFLIYSLSHLIETVAWIQHKVLQKNDLESIHLALLRRAGRYGRVSFDRIRGATGMPIYTISRAAYRLEDRDLGSVRFDRSDKRRRRFHINAAGNDLLEGIELQIGRETMGAIGAEFRESRRYYNFTVHLWNLTRFLPESRVGMEGVYFASKIGTLETIGPEQKTFEQFRKDLLAAPRLEETSRRSGRDLILSD